MKNNYLVAILPLAGIAVTLTLTACNNPNQQATQDATPLIQTEAASSQTEQGPALMDVNEQIRLSVKDLAKRLSIAPDSITMTEARNVNWRSGALGCPKPGMMYTDALVPGMLIILTVDDQSYGYHAKMGGMPFYCPQGQAESPASFQEADLA